MNMNISEYLVNLTPKQKHTIALIVGAVLSFLGVNAGDFFIFSSDCPKSSERLEKVIPGLLPSGDIEFTVEALGDTISLWVFTPNGHVIKRGYPSGNSYTGSYQLRGRDSIVIHGEAYRIIKVSDGYTLEGDRGVLHLK